MQKIEKCFVDIESGLCHYAIIPLVGTFSGSFRISMGLVQTITAFTAALLLAIPALFNVKDSRLYFFRAARFTAHGLGNMCSGVLEAIPIIGSLFALIRVYKDAEGSSQRGFFMAYKIEADPYKAVAEKLQWIV